MNRPCLLLDCYVEDSGEENFRSRLSPLEVETVHATTAPIPVSARPYSALVLTGSAASVLEDPPWCSCLADLIRDAAARDLPILGVCFGHQMVASALLGPEWVGPSQVPEIGWGEIRILESDPILEGFGSNFRTFLSHHDEVRMGSERIRVLAESDGCEIQAFRMEEKPVWGVQFHVEMGEEESIGIVTDKAEKYPDLGLDVGDIVSGWIDSEALGDRLLANFVREVQSRFETGS